MIDLPDEFIARMAELLGDETSAFLASYDHPAERGFRLNPYKPCDLDLSALGDGRIPYTLRGYYTVKPDIGSNPLHSAGAYYVQEPSAMIAAEILDPQEGERVLDMCAAPGGKSGQLAEKIGKSGVLVSNEIMTDRAMTLLGNIERMGYTNVVVTSTSSKCMADTLNGWFDSVLVDAPCSGEGMFRKNPQAVSEWSIQASEGCHVRQTEILRNAGKCVKQGGRLVYSTCTFSVDENENTVREFLSDGDFKLIKIPEKYGVAAGGDEEGMTARLYPHKLRGEGHFVALFERVSPNLTVNAKTPLKSPTNKDKGLIKYIKENLSNTPDVYIFNNSYVLPPAIQPPISKGVLRYGVKIGDVAERLIPHHQLFSAYPELFARQVDLSDADDRLAKYLHGETISTDGDNGWCVVKVDGVALGGGKIVDGVVKNHYPKGLRK